MRKPSMQSYGPPMPPHPAALLVGEAERDQVVERIKTAFAEGRLDLVEFDTRTQLALTARTRADLGAILADLEPAPAPPRPQYQPPTAEERGWALAAHWLPFVTSFIGPMVILLTKGKQSPFVRHQSAEALNFQLTFLLAHLVLMVTVVGVLLYPLLWLCWLVLILGGGIGALTGDAFRYPMTIRLVR